MTPHRAALAIVVTLSGFLPAALEAQTVTWSSQIAPIVYANCTPCHRPSAVAPFSLLSFDDARAHAERIAEVVTRREMPPWKPVADNSAGFHGDRSLEATDIALIQQWVESGAAEGTRTDAPAPPVFDDGWPIGPPDLLASISAPFDLPAGTTAISRSMEVPVDIAETRWVRAFALRQSSSTAIRHARLFLDRGETARAVDASDGPPDYEGLMLAHAGFPDRRITMWTNGVMSDLGAEAWPLEPGTTLVLQLLLQPGNASLSIQPELGFYFTAGPPSVEPVSIILNSKTIDIPPEAATHSVEDRFLLPVATELVAIHPHAHQLGKTIAGAAMLPNGEEISLLQIDDWDLRWEQTYRFREPILLPEGTVLRMVTVFDNSAANLRTPQTPPQRVRFGPGLHDEMAELTLRVVPASESGRETLLESLAVKATRDDILRYQARIRIDPADHVSLSALAGRYLDIAQVDLAIEHLQEAIRLAPDYAEAHFNLGNAYVATGASEQAIAAYRQAISARPNYAAAHNNIGAALESVGDAAASTAHYRLAVRFNSLDTNAHYNLARALQREGDNDAALLHFQQALALGVPDAHLHSQVAQLYVGQGEYATAVEHYETAIALNPDLAAALVDLAWLRATVPDADLRNPVDAIATAERAAALAGEDHPLVLDVLAAAYASDGRFDLAVTTARRAVAQAQITPDFEHLVPTIEARIGLYLSFRPFRMARPEPEPRRGR